MRLLLSSRRLESVRSSIIRSLERRGSSEGDTLLLMGEF